MLFLFIPKYKGNTLQLQRKLKEYSPQIRRINARTNAALTILLENEQTMVSIYNDY